jgi:hypothetical protein
MHSNPKALRTIATIAKFLRSCFVIEIIANTIANKQKIQAKKKNLVALPNVKAKERRNKTKKKTETIGKQLIVNAAIA